ncbi:MAG: hypothetical protein ACI4ES_12845 [Roseburia sp.]
MDYNFQNQNGNLNPMQQKKKDDQNATILCVISIVCALAKYVVLVFGHIGSGLLLGWLTPKQASIFESFSSGLGGLLEIAALVLMIVARVKYPKNVFAKVLMWVYIAIAAVSIIAIAVFIIACGVAIGSCLASCQGMPG